MNWWYRGDRSGKVNENFYKAVQFIERLFLYGLYNVNARWQFILTLVDRSTVAASLETGKMGVDGFYQSFSGWLGVLTLF
jgi:hypothetical protein